jgi:hypothetical protein
MTLKLSHRNWLVGASNALAAAALGGPQALFLAGPGQAGHWRLLRAGSKRNCTAASLAPDTEPHITHCADADVALAFHH